jgi:outer membrane protein
MEGTVSYSKSTGTEATYGFQPTAGYFMTDRFAVGVSGDFGKNEDGAKTTSVSAFGRCYILNIGKNLMTYSQLNIGTTSLNNSGVSTNAFGVNVGLGVNYFISPKLALSMHVADLMNYTSVESNSTFTIGWTGVNNPLAASKFGVLYRF